MSHFLVAVVGKNPHELLAPFREYDGEEDDPYAKLVDVTDGAKEVYEVYVAWKRDRGDVYDASLKEHLLEYERMTELSRGTDVGSLDAATLASKRRFFTVTETGEVDRVYRYTNPNGKWG